MRTWRGCTLVLILAVGGLVATGCVEDRTSLTIQKMLVPNSDCVAVGGSDTYVTMGALDIALIDDGNYAPPQYYLFPEVANHLLSTEEDEGIELNLIEIIEARVTLDFGTLGSALDADTTRFAYPAFVTMAPGDVDAVQVLGIPAPTARVLASLLPNVGDSVIVRIRLKFLYQHGEYERETHEVEFPVQVCRNCLVPPMAPLCSSGDGSGTTIRQGNGCNIVQDTPVDCCIEGSHLICPAVYTGGTTTGDGA